jgi:hypothetical protein
MEGFHQFHQLPVFARFALPCRFCTQGGDGLLEGMSRMIALNRWIALAAAAAFLPAGLAGCKMGNSCHQTNCSAAKVQHAACADGKVACGLYAQNGIGSTMMPPGQAVTPPGYHAPGSKPEPKVIPEESFDAVPGPPGQEQPAVEEKAQQFPFPLPEPVTQIQTTPGAGSAFVPVSQTRLIEDPVRVAYHVPRRSDVLASGDKPHISRAHVQVQHDLSRPWSDALGLPTKEPQAVAPYRGW